MNVNHCCQHIVQSYLCTELFWIHRIFRIIWRNRLHWKSVDGSRYRTTTNSSSSSNRIKKMTKKICFMWDFLSDMTIINEWVDISLASSTRLFWLIFQRNQPQFMGCHDKNFSYFLHQGYIHHVSWITLRKRIFFLLVWVNFQAN